MKLSFSYLEKARKNPAKFGQAYAPKSGGGFNSRHFGTYLVGALKRFHGGMKKDEVLNYFETNCRDKLKLQNYFEQRFSHYQKSLASYFDTFPNQGCQVIQVKKPVTFTMGTHVLTGSVERFDIVLPTGYRATAAHLHQLDWQKELRWPLIQKAFSDELGCGAGEIEVGSYCFESGRYEYRVFTAQEISDAMLEAKTVLDVVQANIRASDE